jgi:hypothetical protein
MAAAEEAVMLNALSGLLIDGRLIPVDGLTVWPPASRGGPGWCSLSPGDYRVRQTSWIRQIIVHTTKGQWPQSVRPGSAAPGHAATVADFWTSDPVHSAAQLVVDTDGEIACLCDLMTTEAFHAEGSNEWSIGIEMFQFSDGSVCEATLAATAKLVQFLCRRFGIPEQFNRGPYRNAPLSRMETRVPSDRGGTIRKQLGGPTCVGVFGHRDNTSERGRGDPGDAIFQELAGLGFEALNFEINEDILVGKARQAALNARGARLAVDGVCGPASWSAMLNAGFARWRDVT